jgi:hypothetical protein
VLGFAVAQLSNQGVFPISVGGLFSAAGSAGMAALGIWYAVKERRSSEYLWPYVLGLAGLLASGLAGKFRNFVVLSPLQAMWYSTISPNSRGQLLFAIAAAFLTVGNVIGVVNVATHDDTSKNSWNLPSAEIIRVIESKQTDCNNDLVILAHDPTLTFLLEQRGFNVISPYIKFRWRRPVVPDKAQCVIALKTFAGGIENERISRMYESLSRIKYDSIEVIPIGRDANFKLKQRLDSRYPEYQCELIYMRNTSGLAAASNWRP